MPLNAAIHREQLMRLLLGILRSSFSKHLAFKGGTLCYFLYGLPRFSTDLDFDLLDPEKSDDIFFGMEKILEKMGTIKDRHAKIHTLFFLFSYAENEMNIKIELNKRIWKSNAYETKSFFGIPFRAMSKDSIVANKLVALTDRKNLANRDLFDVWYFLQRGFSVNEAVILERTGKSFPEYLKFLRNFVEKNAPVSNRILDGLGEVLTEKQKSWCRTELKTELLREIDMRIWSLQKG